MKTHYDIIIVGTGVSGCFTALNLPQDKQILMITKSAIEESDSFLAQGGICVLRDEEDYESFFEDTMKAGHYKNNKEAVDVMISSSGDTIKELISYGVDFESSNGELLYTREGAHSSPRILYHKDLTGKEITQTLINTIKKRTNITIIEHTTMKDLIVNDENECLGIVAKTPDGKSHKIYSDYTVWATGGIGGIYSHSTNYRHLTGDALYIAFKRGVKLKNVDYVQIHPTSLYSKTPGRRFLISESVRGEGAVLLNKDKERFVDELLPRDLLTERIYNQMKKDNTEYVWLSMKPIKNCDIKKRFPTIYKHCKDEGYDITKDLIPVVPSQHYFMGGVKVDLSSKSSMSRLYAVGETSCNGVHGSNRLASNSLLESLVFAKRAALDIKREYDKKDRKNG